MRIISGKFKSKRLTAPKKLPVRPTTDMAKEALFNILNHWYYFRDIKVLDLFSGTGNISYEFASRGTTDIVAVDQNKGCVQFINQTSKELDVDINVLKSDVFTFLEKHQGYYDVIFADPPYDFSDEQFAKIATLVFENNLLNEEGILIIEHSENTKLHTLENFREFKKYGGCVFSFFEIPSEDEDTNEGE